MTGAGDPAPEPPIDAAPEPAIDPAPSDPAGGDRRELVDQRLARQVTDPGDVRRRLADATRTVIRHLVTSTAPDDDLEAVTAAIVEAAARLEERASGRAYFGVAEGSLLSENREFIDYSPLIGLLNPLAPPMQLWRDGDVVRATVTFGPQYEGPPGCVHGGFVAAAFDEVLGVTQSLTGRAGMTAHLEIDYRSPTPLQHEVRFEGRVERTEGRKIHVVATLHAGDRLCAEATGLFVSMRPDVMDRLLRIRRSELGQP